ncbi:MAG: aminotransferase class V-fold PLP-dependent enzyme [Phaeovulum sp.]|uniref:aminotransferase class V-fold PLP-dependent enzyme n=1 Tax=Phaeovulum sp. TaxID=2934796 RepID=UPI00272F51D5|nr:aminotransferase class V-fold PLP-dependent enzyme [Phaeovulum sp.]MDP2061663.1 aminotransferase class V-fold PLP-dependent enzyme [Phaeovulum sp.]
MTSNPLFLTRFRGRLGCADIRAGLHDQIIGGDMVIDGPFGPQPMLYADYVASGRALASIEQTMLREVLPVYANSHTEASYCGARISALRREARARVAELCGAGPEHAVIFTGSGATAGLNRLVHLLGVRQALASGRGATVIVGPYEHHSNILPWRESGARVVEIAEAAEGGPDMAALDAALADAKGLVIGTFSAASNVTGIVTDVVAVTKKLKAAGALAVWDYAGGGPYLPIAMQPAIGVQIDAIAASPHKFVGGPGASGLLILRRDVVASDVPTFPGGGTVRFVSPDGHDYLTDVVEREEAGTPNILGDIRAALALEVKDAVGQAEIDRRNRDLAARGLAAFGKVPRVRLLGNAECPRLPIFSFLVVAAEGGFVHPQLATRMLSDGFGIQARGGCACAGPYGHRLLGIDAATSNALRTRILAGDEVDKPGFVRLNLSYLMSEADVARIIAAVQELPEFIDRHAHRYVWNAAAGVFDPVRETASAAAR